MKTPPIRLAFGAVFWRVFLLTFGLTEIVIWGKVRFWFRGGRRGRRLAALLYFTPSALYRAFLIATLVTVALDLFIRFLIRPIVGSWYNPVQGIGSSETPLGFHLDPNEWIVDEAPARRASGRGWRPGTLILTSKMVWFFPRAWDLEPWSLPLDALRSVTTTPGRRPLGTFVLGVPDRLALRDAEGRDTLFAVADPGAVVDWFSRPELAQYQVSRDTIPTSHEQPYDV